MIEDVAQCETALCVDTRLSALFGSIQRSPEEVRAVRLGWSVSDC